MNNKGLGGILPPLPPSDQDSLDHNKFDGFYKVRSRDFWGDAEIHRIADIPPVKCEHEFLGVPEGVRCTKCNFGLLGRIETNNGKLFSNGQPI